MADIIIHLELKLSHQLYQLLLLLVGRVERDNDGEVFSLGAVSIL